MAAPYVSSPLSSFNPAVRPPSRTDRGGGGGPGSSKNYVLSVPSGFSVRVFKAPTLSASARQYSSASQQLSSVTAKGDIDYKPSSYRDPHSSGPLVRDAPRKLVKPPPLPHAHAHAHEDRERERERSQRGRFGFIHAGPVPNTYIYERSITSSKSDLYHDYYYPPPSESTVSEIDSIFSVTSSASSNSSADDDCAPRGMLQVAQTTSERRPSYGHGGQRSGTPFPVAYHTCPTCSERAANWPDRAAHSTRPLPTPPVSVRTRKDSLVLASERSVPPQTTRPRLPQLRIGDPPVYPAYDQDAQQSAWSAAETGGYLNTSPPPLTRSSSLKSSGSARSNSQHGGVPPPPGLNVYPSVEGPTVDITAQPVQRLPNRRQSEGDQGHIMPPRTRRSSTLPPSRSVRWCEELVCPSPILASQRRKGWFNKRGDQLWRNDGSYKPPAAGEDYPEDLDDYPEPSEGWQNEEGVRIDINRRLIPKAAPRSVLKRTNYCKEESIIAGYLRDVRASPTSDDE